jgi:MFS family permease
MRFSAREPCGAAVLRPFVGSNRAARRNIARDRNQHDEHGGFLFAHATVWLFLARALSGLSTGLAAGALTAWIAELEPCGDRTAAAVLASTANFTGTALGPLLAGGLAAAAPLPLRVPYVVYAVLLVGTTIIVLAPRETVCRRTVESPICPFARD